MGKGEKTHGPGQRCSLALARDIAFNGLEQASGGGVRFEKEHQLRTGPLTLFMNVIGPSLWSRLAHPVRHRVCGSDNARRRQRIQYHQFVDDELTEKIRQALTDGRNIVSCEPTKPSAAATCTEGPPPLL
jgi:hypothetical protein